MRQTIFPRREIFEQNHIAVPSGKIPDLCRIGRNIRYEKSVGCFLYPYRIGHDLSILRFIFLHRGKRVPPLVQPLRSLLLPLCITRQIQILLIDTDIGKEIDRFRRESTPLQNRQLSQEKQKNEREHQQSNHMHTCNSDGKLTPGQLVEACQQAGLDYAIITDHNYNTVKASYTDKNLLVMQGQEITDDLGHINVWGKKVPQDPPYILKTVEDYDAVLAPCREAGATISVNHPFCSMCGFHMDLEHFHFDCVEVWNTIQHSDNIKNMNWWHNQLLQGNHIAAVGGSDFHKDIGPLKLLANPTTIVHTTAKTEETVLQALREGRSVVTNKPGTSMIYLTVGDANVGDTVSYAPGLTGKVAVTKFKKGHTIKVFNNNDVILEHTAAQSSDRMELDFEIRQPGFIRAEIDYTFRPVMRALYHTVEEKYLHADVADLPPFFWAFTNPIWIR